MLLNTIHQPRHLVVLLFPPGYAPMAIYLTDGVPPPEDLKGWTVTLVKLFAWIRTEVSNVPLIAVATGIPNV